MSWATFFPADLLSLSFVLILVAWFVSVLVRLEKEGEYLDSVRATINALEQCLPLLRRQLQWRDRQRLEGLDVGQDPAAFFDTTCNAALDKTGPIQPVVQRHFRTVFVAGCEESQLDTAELNAQTTEELSTKSEQFKYELGLILLAGVLGTLLSLSSRLGTQAVYGLRGQRALPPLIWATLLTLAGGLRFLRHRRVHLTPALAEVRQKTTMVWVPKLYPTVAQRAAQWAIHTLHNAARVSDASELIEQHASGFVASVESAKQAAEAFARGMREFSEGMQASDRSLESAQTRMAGEVQKFSESLARWGSFEDEIRRFYSAMDRHQQQMANEHRGFEAMLAGYHGFVRESTETLEKAATEIRAAAAALPEAFKESANSIASAAAESRAQMAAALDDLSQSIRATYREETGHVVAGFETMLRPVLDMEERLRALSTPFDQASRNMLEIANNIWRLNDTLTSEIRKFMTDSQNRDARAVSGRS